jgi:hypothetical protein
LIVESNQSSINAHLWRFTFLDFKELSTIN